MRTSSPSWNRSMSDSVASRCVFILLISDVYEDTLCLARLNFSPSSTRLFSYRQDHQNYMALQDAERLKCTWLHRNITCGISFPLHYVNLILFTLLWFTSSCTHHLITVSRNSSLWATGWRPSVAHWGGGMSVVLHCRSTCLLSCAMDGWLHTVPWCH